MKLDDFILFGKGFFEFNLRCLFYLGLWPAGVFSEKHLLFYKVFAIILHAMSLNYIMLCTIGAFENTEDMIVLVSNLDKSLVVYNFVLKTFFFILKCKQLSILITEIRQSGDRISEDRERLMAMHVIAITSISSATVGAFALLAQHKGELVVDAWFPFDVNKSQLNLFFAQQILSICFVVCLYRHAAMQGIVCSIIMYFCDQLVEVQNRIRSLKFSREYETEVRQEFKSIVKKHVRLIRYSSTLTNIFKEFFLIQNLAITIELCLNAIMIAVIGMTDKTLLASFLAFLSIALLNAYIFCYLGNELIIQSEGIAVAAYESEWTSWPVDMQKDLLVVIRIAQKPLSVSAGGITTMCIKTFGQAISNGYSIFAVVYDMID